MSDRKKNILIVNSTFHIGGAEEVIAILSNGLDRTRFNVSVCYLKEKGAIGERIEANGVDVVGVSNRERGRTNYFTFLKLRRLLNKRSIDLVHSHDVHSFSDCAICKLTKPSLKFVHTFHFGNYPKRDKSLQRIERLFWRTADSLVTVSRRQKEAVSELYSIPDAKINTLWNGVEVLTDPRRFEVVEKYRSKGRVIIGCINTLIEQKGMFDLIKVARELKDRAGGKFIVVVVGGGHLMGKLKQEVASNGLTDHVIFLGWVENAAREFLPYVDIFFQPSLWEAMSIVLLEAMALGKAIVATGVGETPYVLDNQQGIVVETGDIEAMAISLERLIVDESLRLTYASRAKARYEEAFTAKKMVKRYESLYEELLR